MKELPLVISYYTEGTPYQLEALSLIKSCQELGIEAEVQPIASHGNWERNCAQKPFFIQKKLLEKKRPIFWIDADAVFKKTPDFSFLLEHDLSFREMKRFSDDIRFKYCSGSLFVNYTPRALEFVNQWCQNCQQKIDQGADLLMLDQVCLGEIFESGFEMKVLPLPLSYIKIFDLDAAEIEESEVVIEHYQASRKYKHWKQFL